MRREILNDLREVLLERTPVLWFPSSVWQEMSIINTYGSNAIEGNTLSMSEVREMVVDGLTPPSRPLRDVMETIQHHQAFTGLSKRKECPIDLVTVLELHEEVFRGILPDAGRWRGVDVRISGAVCSPPGMEKVVPSLDRWLQDLVRSNVEGMETMEWVCRTHSTFESIHPFSDGNGRVGRLLMNLQLLQRGWPPINVLPMDRDEYLDALGQADAGDLHPLKGLVTRLMARSLLHILDQVGTLRDRLVPLEALGKMTDKSVDELFSMVSQDELPAFPVHDGLHSSVRAWELYDRHVAYR